MGDPLTEAIAEIIGDILHRGVSVQPQGDGWLVRLADKPTERAPQDYGGSEEGTSDVRPRFEGRLSRSW